MTNNLQHSHIENVLYTVTANSAHSDNEFESNLIARSWKRCVNNYNITPDQQFSPKILEQSKLREYQEAFSDPHGFARNCIDKLYTLISDTGYTLLLTDNNGITLDCRYDPEYETELKNKGLYTGTDWSEDVAGTNGIGTCLVEETSVVIHTVEHFYPIMCGMTCTVSPIFDTNGKLLAALNASTLNPETINQNKLVARLVQQYAQQIETLYFINNYNDQWLLRFSNNKDTSDNIFAGIIAINEDGVITAANRNAFNMLCKRMGNKLNDRPLEEIFDKSFSQLRNAFNQKISSDNVIKSVYTGSQFYFSLNPPANKSFSPSKYFFAKPEKQEEKKTISKKHPDLDSLVGNDVHMQIIKENISKIINMDLHILVTGETGTGKEAMARAIHDVSDRKDMPFVAINCASIPDSLIESELFGYSNGSFTGALKKGMKGKILEANGGTLFLDEIGDMPLHLQTRLLRVLSELEVVPLGETTPVSLDIQLISATNIQILEMIESAQFRSDLYFRLNGISIDLPSLRNRTDKKDLILKIFNSHAINRPNEISEKTMNILMNYSWPGNIRQLINVAKYSNAMCSDNTITENNLPNDIKIEITKDLKQSIHYSEYDLLLNTLKNEKWNITKVSSELNICRATVYRKMKKYNIVPPNEL